MVMDSENIHTIHHVESLRRKASYYWPDTRYHSYIGGASFNDHRFRAALNPRTLISSLSRNLQMTTKSWENHLASDEAATSYNIRKRKYAESTPGPPKRIKLDNGVRENTNKEDESGESDEDDMDLANGQIYPSFWESPADIINNEHQAERAFLQVYQFALHLRYNKAVDSASADHYADDRTAAKWGWLKEEKELCSLLQVHQENASLSQVVDMGKVFMTRYHGHLLALSGQLQAPPVSSPEMLSERWLSLLPDIPWPDGLTEDLFEDQNTQPSRMHRDFITACAILQSHRRAKLEGSLRLHILPKGTYDLTIDLPFELRARFTLSLAIPDTYLPFKGSLPWRSHAELEGLQRRLLCFLSKTPLIRPDYGHSVEEATDVTIPYFLKIMRPPPPLALDVNYESLQPDGLLATLMPFQRRTVAWMLEREGKRITPGGTVVPLQDSEASSSRRLPLFWEEIEIGGRNFFFNRLTSALSPTLPELHTALGGILAEEPGLGKTMECLSLILLNPALDRNPLNRTWDPEARLHVKEIKTTLIVTPPALAAQWADELATYAPGLKVFVYQGWAKVEVPITEADVEVERAKRRSKATRYNNRAKSKRNGKRKTNTLQDDDCVMDETMPYTNDAILDWPNYINQFDVCITTYNALRLDMSIARAPPQRPRRQDVEYKNLTRPRSPLVMCEWYRVIMDEVQMMGTGRSEEMVSLIPRLSSFAVSGTPARAQVSDLITVLRFLRINDLVGPMRMWNRLLKHGFKDLFVSLFQKYSVRTLKSSVKNELTIPQQHRYLVGVKLGRVERHVYNQALGEALAELGLDARGVAAYEGWEVDAGILRSVLRRLRGMCTHPQVGQLLKQSDKLNKSGALKSMADVLESMKDQNWRNLTEDRRARILSLTRLAQLQQHHSEDLDRYQRALECLLTAETESTQLIDDIEACIAQHNLKGNVLKREAQALRDLKKKDLPSDEHTGDIGKGKGKERDSERDSMSPMDPDFDYFDDEDSENQGLPNTPAGEDHRVKRVALVARLRECLIVLHRVKFLQGDVYHVLGSSYSGKEDTAYAGAESLRKELLKSTEEAANRAMQRLSVASTEKRVTERGLQIPLPFMEGGGIRSTHLFEEANEIIEEVLNEQSALLWKWRTKIVELLTQRLSSAGEQADGEEYARTLDTQGEAEAYLQSYAALLADRRETIAAERTLLAAHEGREKKTRKTKAAARANNPQVQNDLQVPDDIEVQPQHEVLYGQLSEQRRELQPSERALKSVMVDLATIAARIPGENDPEKIIAKNGAASLRTLIASLQELTDKLDADIAVLRKVFNDRIVYFRQLQEISDTVAEVQWEGSLTGAMEVAQLDNANLGARINTRRARQRYMEHLAEGTLNVADEDTLCILCQCEFSRGFITQCAHIFCEGCMKAWIARGQRRACPVCRTGIDTSQLQRFTIQEDQPPPQKPLLRNGEPAPTSYREIQYNKIDPALFADIQMMESNGSYGSKIQTLVRHLLHIQLVDQGAKSIIFSAWADSLTIVEHALRSNGIPCMRLDQNQGKNRDGAAKRFRVDPRLQVLLLHGERDNAGLNVTCASRVFLLESVVNHGFEVQAIARIDRMGQTRATEVFCYYAEDTVEKSILDLAARQGLSIYTKDNSAGPVNVTSFAMDSQKKLVDSPTKSNRKNQQAQKGDFIFKVDDMLAILFPHMYEDVEFLLPPEARGEEAPPSVNGQSGPVRLPVRRLHINAEAGPSRLPAS